MAQGVLAKNADLKKAFGTDNHVEVCKVILDKGEMQARNIRECTTELPLPSPSHSQTRGVG